MITSPRPWLERQVRAPWLDRPATWLGRLGDTPLPRLADRAADWIGHPVHPALTDLPIGFWTSASVLDLIGGRKGANAARHLVALGVLSAVPTALAGAGDAASYEPERRREIALHAAANSAATLTFAASWWARHRGHRMIGALLGLAGGTVATVGAYLGGHLSFGKAIEPDEGGVMLAPLSLAAIDADEPLVQPVAADGLA